MIMLSLHSVVSVVLTCWPLWKWPPFMFRLYSHIQSSAVITWSSIIWYCIHHGSDWGKVWTRVEPTKYIPYLTLRGELWDVFCENLGENWPRYNGTARYVDDNTRTLSLKVHWNVFLGVLLMINQSSINDQSTLDQVMDWYSKYVLSWFHWMKF